MADPDCGRTDTRYNISNCPTTSTCSSYDQGYNVTNTYYTPSTYPDPIARIAKQLIKKIQRIQQLNEMKASWIPKKPGIRPSIVRPDIQLRGVCFGGRGWA